MNLAEEDMPLAHPAPEGAEASANSTGCEFREEPHLPDLEDTIVEEIDENIDEFRRLETRDEAARALVEKLRPDTVNPALLYEWLADRHAPAIKKISSPAPEGESIGEAMSRRSKAVKKTAAAVAQADKNLLEASKNFRRAQAEADAAKQKHDAALDHDKLMLGYLVNKHIGDVIAPVFAFGPAWALLRAVSPNYDRRTIAAAMLEREPDRSHDSIRAEIFATEDARKIVSEEIWRSLDLNCGDFEFEEELRAAIHAVVVQFRNRKITDPEVKKRKLKEIMTSPQPSRRSSKQGVESIQALANIKL